MSRFKLTQECSQKWYRLYSWRMCKPRFRKLNSGGIAFGPIMFFWDWEGS